ncbi:hypothetical protein [Bosea sp. BH3]|uniref:hypothetical protein n=1 Tax=Bosea sp. BH3 TaxID=2871701 RepID=UPI0021CB2882|nr:hypothetical protein [Bosea sp. BH3]MCU4182433.1 hypothetical protein [Bosea sp. BH3]
MSIDISSRLINLPLSVSLKPGTQGVSSGDTEKPSTANAGSAEAEFLKFAQMTPEERVQKALLDKLGMTEEEFNKLDAKAKADVMSKIRDEMLAQMKAKGEQRTGELADIRV